MLFIIAVGAFAATMLGGVFALRLKDQLHLVLGFSAGAVIGVAFFDLLPESFGLASIHYSAAGIFSISALGFLLYLIFDRLLLPHRHEEDVSIGRGRMGATTLSLHSLLDGIAIGFSFQVSNAVGLIVALAVLTHDFSDGINTVNFMLKNGGDRRSAFKWLLVDAIMPVVGIIATLFLTISTAQLGALLALFAGFFLYIGASDLVPESHHAHPTRWTTFSTILGAAFMYIIVVLAG